MLTLQKTIDRLKLLSSKKDIITKIELPKLNNNSNVRKRAAYFNPKWIDRKLKDINEFISYGNDEDTTNKDISSLFEFFDESLFLKLTDIEWDKVKVKKETSIEKSSVYGDGRLFTWCDVLEDIIEENDLCFIMDDNFKVYIPKDNLFLDLKKWIHIANINEVIPATDKKPVKFVDANPDDVIKFLLNGCKKKCCVKRVVETPIYSNGYNEDLNNPGDYIFNMWNIDKYNSRNIYSINNIENRINEYEKNQKVLNLAQKSKDFIVSNIFRNQTYLAKKFITHMVNLSNDLTFRQDDIYILLGPQGSGKTWFVELLFDKIIGKHNIVKMKLNDLQRNFNADTRLKRVYFFDEASSQIESRYMYNTLKDISQATDCYIEQKGKEKIHTYMNTTPIILSNGLPIYVESGDRRCNFFWTNRGIKVANFSLSSLDSEEKELFRSCVADLLVISYYDDTIFDESSESNKKYNREREINLLAYNNYNISGGKNSEGKRISLYDEFKKMAQKRSNKSPEIYNSEVIEAASDINSDFTRLSLILPSIKIDGNQIVVDDEDLEKIVESFKIRNPKIVEEDNNTFF